MVTAVWYEICCHQQLSFAIPSLLHYSFLVWPVYLRERSLGSSSKICFQTLLPNCRGWSADNSWAFLRCCPAQLKTLHRALFPLQRSVPQSVLLLLLIFSVKSPLHGLMLSFYVDHSKQFHLFPLHLLFELHLHKLYLGMLHMLCSKPV